MVVLNWEKGISSYPYCLERSSTTLNQRRKLVLIVAHGCAVNQNLLIFLLYDDTNNADYDWLTFHVANASIHVKDTTWHQMTLTLTLHSTQQTAHLLAVLYSPSRNLPLFWHPSLTVRGLATLIRVWKHCQIAFKSLWMPELLLPNLPQIIQSHSPIAGSR